MRSFSPQIYHCFYVSHVMISRAWQEASQTIGRSADHLLILRLADGGGEAHWNMLFCDYMCVSFLTRFYMCFAKSVL